MSLHHNYPTARQLQWLQDEDRTIEEIAAYIASGEADTLPITNFQTGTSGWKPMSAGVIVGETQDSYEAAKSAAQSAVARFGLQADRSASWPTGEHAHAHEALEDVTARVGQMLHLGMAVTDLEAVPEDLEEALEDISQYSGEAAIWSDLPKPPAGDPEDDEDEFYGNWLEMIVRHNVFGFLARVEVAYPRYNDPDDRGFSFSWGMYSKRWIYAESVNEITRKTRQIAADIHKRAREEARQRNQQTEAA